MALSCPPSGRQPGDPAHRLLSHCSARSSSLVSPSISAKSRLCPQVLVAPLTLSLSPLIPPPTSSGLSSPRSTPTGSSGLPHPPHASTLGHDHSVPCKPSPRKPPQPHAHLNPRQVPKMLRKEKAVKLPGSKTLRKEPPISQGDSGEQAFTITT